ncbi:hypothetical protein PS467_34025 [Streptomyces luomodiensis]|uniref:Uncharacterized protein n=1 Tax=Streptomyces luomodiensis TaxID=3026192 RepID=A0ABY9V6S6_9ACTN|nr:MULTISPECIES: hypothetical protein [unclassified Streptomyces]WAP59413.1 hypothetical protein N6H00_33180 [Streptomyces sp. S465]WNE99982.1 hypothetical protein PS467_34025 [Streptomyces sp. SCA4-21]
MTTDSLQPPDHSRLPAEPVFRPRDQGGDGERYPLEYRARVWEDFLRALGRIEADFLQRSDTPEPGVTA